jgi:putative transposase
VHIVAGVVQSSDESACLPHLGLLACPDYERGLLAYLIRDRDPLYTDKFDSILKATGVEPVKLPPRSPNLNPHAERFVRSVREKCLDHLLLSSEEQLRYVLSEYLQYYHHERIHQGLNRIIEPQHEANQGEIICFEHLGGLLKSYPRKAA